MAGYRGNITIRDAKNARSSMTVYMDDGLLTDTEDRVNSLEALAGAIAAYTNGQVVELSVTVDATIPAGAADAAAPHSDVEEKVTLQMETAAGKITRLSIPAVNEAAVFEPDSNRPLAGFLAAMRAQLVDGPYVDSNNSDIVAIPTAYPTYSNRKRANNGN